MNLVLSFIVVIRSVVLLSLLTVVVVQPLIIRRHYHDGVLYEDFAADSDNVRYTITNGEGWDDLDSLVATHSLRDKSMFCSRGPGAWLLYRDAKYQFGSSRQLKLVYGEHCVPADNVNSIQPLGAVYVNLDDISAVVAFSEKYFASKGQTSRDGSISQSIKSAIFTGVGNWTLEAEGKKTCLVVQNLGDVCLLDDILNSFSLTSDTISISKGCGNSSETEMEMYQLQTCYSKGFHELTYDFDFNLPSVQDICKGTYNPEDQAKHKFLSVVKVWKNRINPPTKLNTPSTIYSVPQRLNTLNAMITIMGKTCPGVSDPFLETVKEIYLIHIKHGDIWNVTILPDGSLIERSQSKWDRAQEFIMNCLQYKEEVETGCQPEDISQMKNEKEVATIEDFLNGESYDFVIEHVWLLLNYVSTYCTFHGGYRNNDWSIFPVLFKRDFLYPLQKQWKDPGKWASYYPLMFNGFEIEEERKGMIACVQAIIKKTPFYDPLARPPGFYSGNRTADKDIVGGVSLSNNTNVTSSSKKIKREDELLKLKAITEASIQKTTLNSITASTTEVPSTSTTHSSTTTHTPTVVTTTTTTTTTSSPSTGSTPTKRRRKKTKQPDAAPIIIEIGPTTRPSFPTAIVDDHQELADLVTNPVLKTAVLQQTSNPPQKVKGKKKDKGTKGKRSKKVGNGTTKKARAKLLKSNVAELQKPPQIRPSSFLGDRESGELV